MARHPALQVFRRFARLNLRSILYYEVQLARLQEDLEQAEKAAADSDDPVQRLCSKSWLAQTLVADPRKHDSRSPPVAGCDGTAALGEPGGQWQIMCRIREVLEAYCMSFSLHRPIGRAQRSLANRDPQIRHSNGRQKSRMAMMSLDQQIWRHCDHGT